MALYDIDKKVIASFIRQTVSQNPSIHTSTPPVPGEKHSARNLKPLALCAQEAFPIPYTSKITGETLAITGRFFMYEWSQDVVKSNPDDNVNATTTLGLQRSEVGLPGRAGKKQRQQVKRKCKRVHEWEPHTFSKLYFGIRVGDCVRLGYKHMHHQDDDKKVTKKQKQKRGNNEGDDNDVSVESKEAIVDKEDGFSKEKDEEEAQMKKKQEHKIEQLARRIQKQTMAFSAGSRIDIASVEGRPWWGCPKCPATSVTFGVQQNAESWILLGCHYFSRCNEETKKKKEEKKKLPEAAKKLSCTLHELVGGGVGSVSGELKSPAQIHKECEELKAAKRRLQKAVHSSYHAGKKRSATTKNKNNNESVRLGTYVIIPSVATDMLLEFTKPEAARSWIMRFLNQNHNTSLIVDERNKKAVTTSLTIPEIITKRLLPSDDHGGYRVDDLNLLLRKLNRKPPNATAGFKYSSWKLMNCENEVDIIRPVHAFRDIRLPDDESYWYGILSLGDDYVRAKKHAPQYAFQMKRSGKPMTYDGFSRRRLWNRCSKRWKLMKERERKVFRHESLELGRLPKIIGSNTSSAIQSETGQKEMSSSSSNVTLLTKDEPKEGADEEIMSYVHDPCEEDKQFPEEPDDDDTVYQSVVH
jgi:hypothetical protein